MIISPRQKIIVNMTSLVLLFFGPLIAAIYFYHYGLPWKTKTIQHGHLQVSPPSLSEVSVTNIKGEIKTIGNLKGQWLLLYKKSGVCDKTCQGNVYALSRVHRALGKNADRVQQVLLALNEPVVKKTHVDGLVFNGVTSLYLTAQQQKAWDQTIQAALPVQDVIFIADPHGNLVLSYTENTPPSFILRDMEHLLRISHIG